MVEEVAADAAVRHSPPQPERPSVNGFSESTETVLSVHQCPQSTQRVPVGTGGCPPVAAAHPVTEACQVSLGTTSHSRRHQGSQAQTLQRSPHSLPKMAGPPAPE